MATSETLTKRHLAAVAFAVEIDFRYPGIFNPANPVPLKIGIHFDLFQVCPNTSKTNISRFLRWWTARQNYQKVRALAEAGNLPRRDLWGNEQKNGPVAEQLSGPSVDKGQ